jgi:hypothetical protein
MRKYFLILSFVIIGCKDNRMKEHKIINLNDKVYTKYFSDKSFTYKVYYKRDSTNTTILKNVIIRKNKKIIQKIKLDTIEVSRLYFSIDDDINFDGFNDICLLNYEGSYTSTFSFWLYDKKSNQFKHYKDLDEIQNPAIIKDKKEICSSWHSGVSDFYLERYFWKNDSLLLKEKYEENITDKKRLTITKLMKGKYIVKDSIIKDNVVMFMKCQ